ncbi:MAG: hypothetical protein IPO66_11660 [Rhodanobacteraceae bacterium]|nr:hypothetical protein [Rhodanobacteraceae bacterium]
MSIPQSEVARLPPRIVLDVDAELGDYLVGELARHWPRALVTRRTSGQPVVADLMVVNHEPRLPLCCPTLWLAGIDGSQSLHATRTATGARLCPPPPQACGGRWKPACAH